MVGCWSRLCWHDLRRSFSNLILPLPWPRSVACCICSNSYPPLVCDSVTNLLLWRRRQSWLACENLLTCLHPHRIEMFVNTVIFWAIFPHGMHPEELLECVALDMIGQSRELRVFILWTNLRCCIGSTGKISCEPWSLSLAILFSREFGELESVGDDEEVTPPTHIVDLSRI